MSSTEAIEATIVTQQEQQEDPGERLRRALIRLEDFSAGLADAHTIPQLQDAAAVVLAAFAETSRACGRMSSAGTELLMELQDAQVTVTGGRVEQMGAALFTLRRAVS